METSLAVIPAASEGDHALAWSSKSEAERKQQAAKAARDADLPSLVGLSEAWAGLYGSRGARGSAHTRSAYKAALGALVAFSRQGAVGLLRPRKDFGASWKARMEADGLSTSTVRLRLAAGRRLYAALRWSGATEADPFAGVRPAQERTSPEERARTYSAAEVGKLFQAATDTLDRLAVALGAHGLRIAEFLGLRVADCDLATGSLQVLGKGGKRRTVHLDSEAVQAIQEYLQSARRKGSGPGLLIPPITPQGFRARLRRLCKGAKVPYRGFHALRHYCGTALYERTADLGAVADHLGHASLDTARIYAKRYPKLRETIQAGMLPRAARVQGQDA
jgi:integrase/recombinase XerC